MSLGNYYVIGDIKTGGHYQGQHKILKYLGDLHNTSQPEILYIGAACKNEPKPKYGFIGGVKKIFPDCNVSCLTLSPDNKNVECDEKSRSIESAFETADIVYFDAGEVLTLKAVFDKFKLKKFCAQAFERGAAVGGMCGGGSFLADEVVHFDVQSGDFIRDIGARLWPEHTISCHMDREDEFSPRYKQLSNISYDRTKKAIGLGVDQAVIFDGFNEYALVSAHDQAPPFRVDRTGVKVSLPVQYLP